MMRVFFDASAFAKRYIHEEGSETVLFWCERATELALPATVLPEIVSGFCQLRRDGKITVTQYRQLKAALFEDAQDITLCEVSSAAIQHAVHSLETQILGGTDAVSIGCALAWHAEVFVSADRRQCFAAQATGLRVIEL